MYFLKVVRKKYLITVSADLLQTQTDGLGALDGTDELALAYGLFNDVTKVFKVLEKKTEKDFSYDH